MGSVIGHPSPGLARGCGVEQTDRVRTTTVAAAEALLADLQRLEEPPQPEAVVRAGAGWTVLVVTFPTPGQEVPGLSECDRDCLKLLAQLKEPYSAARLRKELEKRGIGTWGLITVKRSLAWMKRMKLVANSRRSPRGYYLEETLPIAQILARR